MTNWRGCCSSCWTCCPDYGLDDFYLELSTKDPDKYVGSDEIWDEATDTLREVAEASGLHLVPDPGGAAFYGPKISVQVKDALGRSWQMSTIQLDFNMPDRFELEYTAPDGTGSARCSSTARCSAPIERFIGILTEHYAGAFPAWLAPVQVVASRSPTRTSPTWKTLSPQLRSAGIRAEVDSSDDRMAKKIVNQTNLKVPFIAARGDPTTWKGRGELPVRRPHPDQRVPVADRSRPSPLGEADGGTLRPPPNCESGGELRRDRGPDRGPDWQRLGRRTG